MTCGQMLFHRGGKISNNKHIERAGAFLPSLQASPPVIMAEDFQRSGLLPGFRSALCFP